MRLGQGLKPQAYASLEEHCLLPRAVQSELRPPGAYRTLLGFSHAKGLGAAGPMLTLLHRRRARRLWLRPRRHHRQQDAKGRVQTGRDGAWVRREQSLCSWDPPAHFREAPIRRYSGCPQPSPSSARSPDAHVMLLGRKGLTAAPHWKDMSIPVSGETQYVRALGKIFEAGGQPVKNRKCNRCR